MTAGRLQEAGQGGAGIAARDRLIELGLISEQTDSGSESRNRILTAALELFAEKGVDATSVRDVAARVGVHPSTLYAHFESKGEIVDQAIWSTLTWFFTFTVGPLAADEEPGRLRGLVCRHVRFRALHRDVSRVTDWLLYQTEATQAIGETHQAFRDSQRLYVDLVRELVAREVPAASKQSLTVYAYSIVGMCERVSSWYSPDGTLSVEELEAECWAYTAGALGIDALEGAGAGSR